MSSMIPMVLLDYFEEVFNGIEFLIALGSILVYMGTIFLLIGILSFFNMRPGKAFTCMILGIILLSFAAYFLIPGSVGTTDQPVPKGYH